MIDLRQFPNRADAVRKQAPQYRHLHGINKIVKYIIDSDARQAINLQKWLSDDLNQLFFSSILNVDTEQTEFDDDVLFLFKKVKADLKYTQDRIAQKKIEHWSRPSTIYNVRNEEPVEEKVLADCEDGAGYLYLLCRLAGVPANRLFWAACDVETKKKTFGHSMLLYIPDNYPTLFWVLDWCVYPSDVLKKPLYAVHGKVIKNIDGKARDVYRNLWFSFNEDYAYTKL